MTSMDTFLDRLPLTPSPRIPAVPSPKAPTSSRNKSRSKDPFTAIDKSISDALSMIDDAALESQKRVKDLVKMFEGGSKGRKPSGMDSDLPPGEKVSRTRSFRRSITGSSMFLKTLQSIESALPRSRSASRAGSRSGSKAPSIANSRRTSFSGPKSFGNLMYDPYSKSNGAVADEEVPVKGESGGNFLEEDPFMQGFMIKQLVQQLEAVQADKARLAEENSQLKRENEGLREMLSMVYQEDHAEDMQEEFLEDIAEGEEGEETL